MATLVLGGYGAVGGRIVAQLRARGEVALAAGRDVARADRVLDLAEPGAASLRAALTDVDVVVNAAGVEDPSLASLITGHGAAFVDITATTGYVTALAVSAVQVVAVLAAGVHHLHQMLTLDDVPAGRGIRVHSAPRDDIHPR